MKEYLKSNIEERPSMIVLGILCLYFLIAGFIFYLYFLHRISILTAIILILSVSILYVPRFLIINKLNKKDIVKIIDDYIMINGVGVKFSDIIDYKVKEAKPQIVFFINNKMIVFQEAEFYLRLRQEQISFEIIGTEKISLMKEFLKSITDEKNKKS